MKHLLKGTSLIKKIFNFHIIYYVKFHFLMFLFRRFQKASTVFAQITS